MNMAQGIVCVTLQDFEQVKGALEEELIAELEEEMELSGFENDDDDSDLWDSPTVDSKAVIKLSPVVEKHTGKKVKPDWIKPGGYDSVHEAIKHIMKQLELDFKANGDNNP